MKRSQDAFACGARTGVSAPPSSLERRAVVHGGCEKAVSIVNDEPIISF